MQVTPSPISSKKIPMWHFPSSLVVAWEHVYMVVKGCPRCGSNDVEFIRQVALSKIDPNWPYPINGDDLMYKCLKCDLVFTRRFIFRQPKPQERPMDLFNEILHALLDMCSRRLIPDYFTFTTRMQKVLDGLKMDDHIHGTNLYEQAIKHIANELKELFLMNRQSQDTVIYNKLKLLLNLCSWIPFADFKNYMASILPSELYNMICKMREGKTA